LAGIAALSTANRNVTLIKYSNQPDRPARARVAGQAGIPAVAAGNNHGLLRG
jgi:hypothetical protein